MENDNKTMAPVAFKYGILTSLGVIILSLVFYIMDMSANKSIQWLGYVILAAGIVLATTHHRDKNLNGYISYGNALGLGTLISLNVGIISAFYTYIFFAFIDQDLINQLLSQIEQEMYQDNNSEEQIEVAMRYTKMFMTPTLMSVMVVLMNTFLGFMISLVTSAILKKENANPIMDSD